MKQLDRSDNIVLQVDVTKVNMGILVDTNFVHIDFEQKGFYKSRLNFYFTKLIHRTDGNELLSKRHWKGMRNNELSGFKHTSKK